MIRKSFKNLANKPGAVVGSGFLVFILTGTILLMLPSATVDGKGTSLIDAFFTSTSALCVTGLIVQDTAVYFSRFGHVIILILIQIGGLGIMTSYAFISIAIGKRLLISQQVAMKGVLDAETSDIRKTVLFIITSTFIIEAIGTVVLARHWSQEPLDDYVFCSVFHSVSAFCNAGFSLFSNSLINYSGDTVINVTFALLIVSGGLGYVVISNLSGCIVSSFRRDRKRRINLHTKIVLTMTSILIIVGSVLFYAIECMNTLEPFSVKDKVFVSLFQSITTRTAGFNTVEISSLTKPAFLLFIFLMFIGGSSGSAAGGIKVGTFFVLNAVVYSMFRGRGDVDVFERTIHRRTVQKAVSVATISLLTVLIFCLILLYTEDKSFQAVIFEVFSAFGNVGLSTGLSSDLTNTGKVLITILMFTGRIGPLTLALVLGRDITEKKISFPVERIVVG